jgi:hypothetical protein
MESLSIEVVAKYFNGDRTGNASFNPLFKLHLRQINYFETNLKKSQHQFQSSN